MFESAILLLTLAIVAGLLFDAFRYGIKLTRALMRAVRAFGATPNRTRA